MPGRHPSKDITGQDGAIIRCMLTQHKLSDSQRQEPNVTRVIHLQSACRSCSQEGSWDRLICKSSISLSLGSLKAKTHAIITSATDMYFQVYNLILGHS